MNLGEPSLKKTGKFGKNSQRGGLKKTEENSQFQFGNYPRGGGSSLIENFSQSFPLFLVTPPLSKKSERKKQKQDLGLKCQTPL